VGGGHAIVLAEVVSGLYRGRESPYRSCGSACRSQESVKRGLQAVREPVKGLNKL
jgi:hypothetical protein